MRSLRAGFERCFSNGRNGGAIRRDGIENLPILNHFAANRGGGGLVLSKRYISYLLPVVLAACGGGGGTSSPSGSAPTPTPAPSATPTPTPSPTPTASPTPAPTGWAAQAAALYDVVPDVATCRAGTLKASVKATLLTNLNAIRALHRLPAVSYSEVEDAQEADSSLIMAANRALSHTPPTSWTCYSSSGATGAGASNLIIGWGTGLGFGSEDDQLAGWMNEGGSAQLGHRRWMLSPFLGKTSYGRVSTILADGTRVTAASLRVFSFAGGSGSVSGVPAFVAYPFGDYPIRYFRANDYLSFSAIANNGGSFGANSNVRYGGAAITVTGPSGNLAVSAVTSDNDGYGVANNVQWRVAGLQQNVTYTVRISGVTGAPQSEYSYTFRMVP